MGFALRGVLGGALVVGFSHAVLGADTIWISNSNAKLGTIPVAPGVQTPNVIGAHGDAMTDIAWDTSGNLWGVGGLLFQHFYSINPSTGAATDLGDMGTSINSLGCAPDGTMYAAYSSLYTVNTGTATLTPIGPLGYQASGDLAFAGGVCYVSAQDPGGFGSDVLLSVNTTTGAGTVIGATGFTNVYGLGTDSTGQLYGGSANVIFKINTTTGAGTPYEGWLTGFNGDFGAVMGMDITPGAVPEPASLGVLGLGAASLLWRRRRR